MALVEHETVLVDVPCQMAQAVTSSCTRGTAAQRQRKLTALVAELGVDCGIIGVDIT